ncbi:MAG: MerR family transcriptional regulator [Lachnospiraceae bacterium]|nr:MerR family transcriptional regulator [Lachnospiraceae bacterium]
MTIKEVCKRYNITPDTLRYYERVGVIPEVKRTAGGIRNYEEEDLRWIEHAICMREAGVPVDILIEYVKLCRQGDDTFEARSDLLKKARVEILEARKKYDDALKKLDYKIQKYDEAVKTGHLDWDCKK